MKKILTSLLSGLLVISCSNTANVNNTNEKFKIPIEKVNFKLSENTPIQPKMLTFESKVPIKSLKMVKELPDGKSFKFSFEVNPKKINKNTVKIPLNGNFKLTVKKGIKFSVIDNDGTDGNAIIEIPENAVNYFLGVPDKDDDKKVPSLGKITVEDKLYYIKQEIKQLTKKERKAIFEKEKKENEHKKESENKKDSDDKKFDTNDSKDDKNDKNEKDHYNNGTWYTGEKEDGTWYNVGKRALNVPSEWKTENGNNYVLNLTNEGLSNFILRGYKTSNANDFEYPDGVNLIGVKGGIVSLTGVGKIEIPEGALDKDTFISMTQEKEAPEMLGYVTKERIDDYISPVVKIEPMGLKLNKQAVIYLETDTKRLGKNQAALIEWRTQKYSEKFQSFLYYSGDLNDNTKKIKYDSSALLSEFTLVFKVIGTHINPDDSWVIFGDEDPFKIQANPQDPNQEIVTKDAIISYNQNKTSFSSASIIEERVSNSYKYYTDFLKVTKPKITSLSGKLIISIKADFTKDAITEINGAFSPTITIKDTEPSIEHEVWHAFQIGFVGAGRYLYLIGIQSLDGYNPFPTDLGFGEKRWLIESSAEHMGARVFKKYYNSKYNNYTETHYQDVLGASLTNLELSLPLDLYDNKTDPFGYQKVSYMTYITNKETNVNNIDCNSENCDKFMTKIIDDLSLNNFHNYAFHSYMGDRFDIYKSGKINGTRIYLNATNNKKTLPSFTLKNNSTKYYNFYTNDNKNRSNSLGLEIKSSCGSSLKARVLFFDNLDKPIVLPQYLNDDNPNLIDSSVFSLFTDKIALNLDFNKKYPFINFGTDFRNAVLVVSNSDGTSGNGTNCDFDVTYCLYCV
ncbi:MAG: hypothetical protein AABZ74_05535 [Cyanobacteriota bacterium]